MSGNTKSVDAGFLFLRGAGVLQVGEEVAGLAWGKVGQEALGHEGNGQWSEGFYLGAVEDGALVGGVEHGDGGGCLGGEQASEHAVVGGGG